MLTIYERSSLLDNHEQTNKKEIEKIELMQEIQLFQNLIALPQPYKELRSLSVVIPHGEGRCHRLVSHTLSDTQVFCNRKKNKRKKTRQYLCVCMCVCMCVGGRLIAHYRARSKL